MAALQLLRDMHEAPGHAFWHDDISITARLEPGELITSAQTTDVYLLGLAAHRGEKLATLDERIPADAVSGGRAALELVPN